VTERIDDLLGAALRIGTHAALEEWASTGRPGLLLLREYLARTWDPPPAPGVHARDILDNAAAAAATIASANPVSKPNG
jgi:hypothetical protein